MVRDTTLRVSYVGTNSYRMSQTVDLNQLAPSRISPNPNPKPYPNWGRILSSENRGSVSYEGLQSEINHRSSGGLTLQASHVWAKSLGNVGGHFDTGKETRHSDFQLRPARRTRNGYQLLDPRQDTRHDHIDAGIGEHHAGNSAHRKQEDKAKRPQHRGAEFD